MSFVRYRALRKDAVRELGVGWCTTRFVTEVRGEGGERI